MKEAGRQRVDLQSLPQVRDGWTFLYVERARVEREDASVVLMDKRGKTQVPMACLSVLLLGPGTAVTHAAMTALADCGCSVVWCGEGGVRTYAWGLGETRRAANLMHQAKVWAADDQRLEVVHRMYRMRFRDPPPADARLEQLRGMEGARVRDAYARVSRETGIEWRGRSYSTSAWQVADPINRALSVANACLYGLCHAAIVATGFSPGLGFIHVGKMLSFVYDIADLYKMEITVPIAFRAALAIGSGLEGEVRRACRDSFLGQRLLARIVPDIQRSLGMRPEAAELAHHVGDLEVGELWDPDRGAVKGGVNFGEGEGGGQEQEGQES